MEQCPYDLILLDVMLPQRNGWSVMSELRRQVDTPVIFLTARDAVPDRIKGLDLGADDYLLKPFAFSELLARIRTVLRRGPVHQASALRVGNLELDLVRHQARRGGQQLVFTAKEFSLLALMAQHQGEVLTRTHRRSISATSASAGWTEEGHLYAWHMKLRGKSGRVRFVVTEASGETFKVSPRGYLKSWQRRKMATRPDMIHQFVYYLGERLRAEGREVVSIRVHARVSLNGRRRQYLLDPQVNLLREPRTIWPAPWIKPLKVPLHERR